MKTKLKTPCIAISLAFATASSASAATITASSQSGLYTVSASDLLQTQLSSTTNLLVLSGENRTVPGDLIDGTPGGALDAGGLVIQGGMITYTLDITVNTAGYDLTGIDTYAGWRDGGRDNQRYTVSYATVVAPLTFISIATVFDEPVNTPQNRIQITDIGATGVGAIRFDFSVGQENSGVGYKELDVFGTVTPIPEPSTALLGGLGLLAIMRRRRP